MKMNYQNVYTIHTSERLTHPINLYKKNEMFTRPHSCRSSFEELASKLYYSCIDTNVIKKMNLSITIRYSGIIYPLKMNSVRPINNKCQRISVCVSMTSNLADVSHADEMHAILTFGCKQVNLIW